MFLKLLKHDFKAVFRYWWLLLPSLPVLCALLGISLRFMTFTAQGSESFAVALLVILVGLFMLFAFILVAASALVTPILSLIRFYKHFYTDEGYLTFTLPVKRSTLFLSKLVNALIFDSMYVALMTGSVSLLILIVEPRAFSEICRLLFASFPAEIGVWVFVFLLEGLLLSIASDLFSNLLLYFCITVGALIVKKAKLVAGLAIYYGVYAGLSTVLRFVFAFSPYSLAMYVQMLEGMSIHEVLASIAILLLIVIAVILTLAFTLFSMTVGRIERKLNLP